MPVSLDESPLVGAWQPDPFTPSPPTPARWSRRRVVVTLVVAGLAAGGVCWHRAVTADPGLEFGAAASNVFGTSGDKTGVTEVTNLVGDEATIAFEPGGRFSAWMSLHNDGPRVVTITSFPKAGFFYWGVERVVAGDDDTDLFPEGDDPTGSFRLDAGETRYLRVDFKMADCDPAGLQDGHSFITSLPVTYRTLGFTRTVRVPFDDAAIAVDTMGRCDQPLY